MAVISNVPIPSQSNETHEIGLKKRKNESVKTHLKEIKEYELPVIELK